MTVVHAALAALALLSLASPRERAGIRARTREEWGLDLASLGVHFALLPFLQIAIAFALYAAAIPSVRGTLELGWGTAFLAYAAIDYGWYWNHRAFHAETRFWSLHQVHHAPKRLDVFASARNSILSPFCMVYFWTIPLFVFLARDPGPFLAFVGFGTVVNFWGHTGFVLPRGSRFGRFLALFLIQPEDHRWHHSAENPRCNFGTVFNFWDRLHGSWVRPGGSPKALGFDLRLSPARKLFYPF